MIKVVPLCLSLSPAGVPAAQNMRVGAAQRPSPQQFVGLITEPWVKTWKPAWCLCHLVQSCAIFPSGRNWGFQCQIRSCEVEVIKWLSQAHTSPRRLVEGEPTVRYDPITSLLVNPLHYRSHHQNDTELVQLLVKKNVKKAFLSSTGMCHLVDPFARHVVLAVLAVPRAPCHPPPVPPRRCDPRTET